VTSEEGEGGGLEGGATQCHIKILFLARLEENKYCLTVRQCVPVTFSKSGVFSRKSDPKPENNTPEFPVHFRSGKEAQNMVCFESSKIRPKVVKNDKILDIFFR
jgi:hypothetical protein